MEDSKNEINFDPSLLYYSTSNKVVNEDEKSVNMNVETYDSNNRKYICNVCGKRFFTNNSLNVHINNHTSEERLNMEKDENNIDWKSRFVLCKGISCSKAECNFIALDAVGYSKHVSICEGVRITNGNNFCELCGFYFTSGDHLKTHLILSHPEYSPDISMKEYDAKRTTISDPICLYVSDNSTSEDDNAFNKTVTHSMYPDSFLTKKKLKDSDSTDAGACKIFVEEGNTENAHHVSQHYNIGISGNSIISSDESIIADTNQCANIISTNEVLTSSNSIDNTAFCSSSNIEILSLDDSAVINGNPKPIIVVSETENTKIDALDVINTQVSQDNIAVSYNNVSTNDEKATVDSIIRESDQRISKLFLDENISDSVNNSYIVENVKNINNSIPLNSEDVKSVELTKVTQNTGQDKDSTSDEVLLDMLNSDENKEFHELKTSSYYESFANLELISDSLATSSQDVDRGDQYLGVEKNMYKLFKGNSSRGYDSYAETVYPENKGQFPSGNYAAEMKQESVVNFENMKPTNINQLNIVSNSVSKNNIANTKKDSEYSQSQAMKKKNLKTINKGLVQKVKKLEIFHSTPKSENSNMKKFNVENKNEIRSLLQLKSAVNNKLSVENEDEPTKPHESKFITSNAENNNDAKSLSKSLVSYQPNVGMKDESTKPLLKSLISSQSNIEKKDDSTKSSQPKIISFKDLISGNHDLFENTNNKKNLVDRKTDEKNFEPEKLNFKSATNIQSFEKNVKQKNSVRKDLDIRENEISRKSEMFTLGNSAVSSSSGRSTRVRKKLILPDFEYDIEFKNEYSSTSENKENFKSPSATANRRMDGDRRGRGRPRKSDVIDSNFSRTSNTKNKNIEAIIKDESLSSSSANESFKSEQSKGNTEEDSEEVFPLTVIESNSDRLFNENVEAVNTKESKDFHFNEISKIDFGKKKRGRPTKMHKITSASKFNTSSSDLNDTAKSEVNFEENEQSQDYSQKKKRGRPRKSTDDQTSSKKIAAMKIENIIESVSKNSESDSEFELYEESNLENNFENNVLKNIRSRSKRKRGRPRKFDDFRPLTKDNCSPKKDDTEDLGCRRMKYVKYDNENSAFSRKGLHEFKECLKKRQIIKNDSSNDSSNVSILQDLLNEKKRGRPRKSPEKHSILADKQRGRPKKFMLLNKGGNSQPSKLQMLTKLKLPEGIVLIKKKKLGQPCIKKVVTFNANGSFSKDPLISVGPNTKKESPEPNLQKKNQPEPKLKEIKTNEVTSSLTQVKKVLNTEEAKNVKLTTESDTNCSISVNEMENSSENIANSTSIIESNNSTLSDHSKNKTSSPTKKRPRGKWPRKKENIEGITGEESYLNGEMDETININKELYDEDLKNYSKFWRVFKKINDRENSNDVVTCGRCKNQMTLRHYKRCHRVTHYFLCWLDGEMEVNLENDDECIRILQSHINPDALRKKAIRFACEKCGDMRKSVIGYVSHVRFCNKTNSSDLFTQCKYCGKVLKPSSLKFHNNKCNEYAKAHVSSSTAYKYINNADRKSNSTKKNFTGSFDRKSITKIDVLEDSQFWINLKTSHDLYSCMGLGCKHMTLSKHDLKSHILHCQANFCEFSCFSCQYQTKYENEIIYHSKKGCKDAVTENTEAKQIENDVTVKTNTMADANNKRVSTRVKKRKYKYDSDELIENDKNKKKDNHDVTTSESEYSEDDYVCSGSINTKSRSKKNKANISLTSISDDAGIREAFQNYCLSQNCDPLTWTVEVRLKTFSFCAVHQELKINKSEWETFPLANLSENCPIESNSMKVTFDNDSFVEFSLFQSNVIKTVPVCYIGGPVWAMSWAPLPAFVSEQYLAVSGLQNKIHGVQMNTAMKFPSLIQIWKFSSLDNISNEIYKPILSVAIKHDFGAVRAMEWCSSGGYDNSTTPCRLGILACATSAGCAIVYSIPKLDNGAENTKTFYIKEPDLILKVRTDNVQCTRLVWQRNYLHTIIYGGFSNGMVALWNISTSSPILKEDKIIYPYRTFDAHDSAITGLDIHWLDKGRYLLTSSFSRVTKYWDLEDLSGPIYESKNSSPVLDAIWMQHWMVTLHDQEFVSTNESSAALSSHPREVIDKRKSILNIRDSTWSVAYSDWNDAVAISTSSGYISVYASKYLSSFKYKYPEFEKIVTETKLVPLENNIDSTNDDVEKIKNVENSLDQSTIINKYGLFFSDRVKQKMNPENFCFDLKNSNTTSINKICWNQNYNSFNWIAVGYECGFVRVIRVERFDKHHLTKFYKMNENSSIALI